MCSTLARDDYIHNIVINTDFRKKVTTFKLSKAGLSPFKGGGQLDNLHACTCTLHYWVFVAARHEFNGTLCPLILPPLCFVAEDLPKSPWQSKCCCYGNHTLYVHVHVHVQGSAIEGTKRATQKCTADQVLLGGPRSLSVASLESQRILMPHGQDFCPS